MKPPCADCGRVHHSQMARIINRFTLPHVYRADYRGAPDRDTRAMAERDMCIHWRKENK